MGFTSKQYTEALKYAAKKHRSQARKGSTIPYVSHVMAVSGIVWEAGGTETEAIAALLHDVVEDCDVSLETLENKFGADVARIVEACSDYVPATDGPVKPAWGIRKQIYIDRLSSEPKDALLVSAADKIHNGESILHDIDTFGADVWGRFNAAPDQIAWYYESVFKAVEANLGNEYVIRRLERLVKALRSAADEVTVAAEAEQL